MAKEFFERELRILAAKDPNSTVITTANMHLSSVLSSIGMHDHM